MDVSHVPPGVASGDPALLRLHAPPAPHLATTTTTTPDPPGAATTATGRGLTSTPPPRRSVSGAKPGLLFQNKILAECYSLVVSPLGPGSIPGELWITSPSLPKPSPIVVANMLNFYFTVPSDRFVVSMPSPGVFFTSLASQNVANIVLSRGAQKLGSSMFIFHASLCAAEAAVSAQNVEGPDLDASAKCNEEEDATVPDDSNKQEDKCNPRAKAATFWKTNSCLPPLLSTPRVPSCMPFEREATSTVLETANTAPHSYREALLRGGRSPSQKTRPPPSLTPPKIHPNSCYRCFAIDHHIRACREPIRCRSCGRPGHRQKECSMAIDRVLTPWQRRRPAPATPLSHAARLPPHAATPPVPPVPSAAPGSPPPHRPSPLRRCSSLPSILSSTSPPPSPPLPPLREIHPSPEPPAPTIPSPLQPTLNSPISSQGSALSASSETVNSSSPASSGRSGFLEIFLPPGLHEDAARLAYVRHSPLNAVPDPAPFIWAAVRTALPQLCFDVLPSSHGSLPLRFLSTADRGEAVRCSPLLHEDVRVDLERHDHASELRHADLLVALSVQSFPLALWHDRFIRQAFQGFGSVVEVDWRCLTGFDYSSVRVVVQVDEIACVPGELWVRVVSVGSCDVCLLQLIRAWARSESFDADGEYIPFFGPPPPPPPHTPPPNTQASRSLPALPPTSPRRAAPGPPRPPHHTSRPHIANIINNVLLALLAQPHAPLLPALPPFPITITLPSAEERMPRSPIAHETPLTARVPVTPGNNNEDALNLWDVDMDHEASARKERTRAKRAADLSAKLKKRAQPVSKRHSARLRAKESDVFEDMTTKASRLKTMRNELGKCSKDLQVQVKRRGLLHKRTLNASDLRALAGTANLSVMATAKLDRALQSLG